MPGLAREKIKRTVQRKEGHFKLGPGVTPMCVRWHQQAAKQGSGSGLISNDHKLQLIAIAIKTIPIKAPVPLVYKLQLLEFVKKALIAISSVAFQGQFYGFFQLNYSIYRVPEVEESQRLAGVLESGYKCYISSRNSIMGIPFGMNAV